MGEPREQSQRQHNPGQNSEQEHREYEAKFKPVIALVDAFGIEDGLVGALLKETEQIELTPHMPFPGPWNQPIDVYIRSELNNNGYQMTHINPQGEIEIVSVTIGENDTHQVQQPRVAAGILHHATAQVGAPLDAVTTRDDQLTSLQIATGEITEVLLVAENMRATVPNKFHEGRELKRGMPDPQEVTLVRDFRLAVAVWRNSTAASTPEPQQ